MNNGKLCILLLSHYIAIYFNINIYTLNQKFKFYDSVLKIAEI